ncbi:dihydroxy-acid dehydratase, partial [Mycobacterium tuberculosis]|nr:dihydroxy-acid dehydratase [Mycobacterium tuberculosis]
DDPALAIDETCLLFIRGTGPLGYPGAAEVVNMRPPAYLLVRDINSLPCIGDGRQSGTSGSPSRSIASITAAAMANTPGSPPDTTQTRPPALAKSSAW